MQTLSVHSSMTTETCCMLQENSLRISLATKTPYSLDPLGTFRDGRGVDELPVLALFVVGDFFLHSLDEIRPIMLLHRLTVGVTLVGCVSGQCEMVKVVESAVTVRVDFFKVVDDTLPSCGILR